MGSHTSRPQTAWPLTTHRRINRPGRGDPVQGSRRISIMSDFIFLLRLGLTIFATTRADGTARVSHRGG